MYMVTTVMETTFRNTKPKVIRYHDYKYFCNNTFWEGVSTKYLFTEFEN